VPIDTGNDPIPNDATLVGLPIYAQALIIEEDPANSNSFRVGYTSGLKITVGD
jgi:hypothetical protein